MQKRKRTGGSSSPPRKKRKHERGGEINLVSIGESQTMNRRTRGGNVKSASLRTQYANVADNTGKVRRLEILRVVRNPSNRDYDRRGVITRGAIIETSEGQARVTSKPGQSGVVNAVLMPA